VLYKVELFSDAYLRNHDDDRWNEGSTFLKTNNPLNP